MARLVLGALAIAVYSLFAYLDHPSVGLGILAALAAACVRSRVLELFARPGHLFLAVVPSAIPCAVGRVCVCVCVLAHCCRPTKARRPCIHTPGLFWFVAKSATEKRREAFLRLLRSVEEPTLYEQRHTALDWRCFGVGMRSAVVIFAVRALPLAMHVFVVLRAIGPNTTAMLLRIVSA